MGAGKALLIGEFQLLLCCVVVLCCCVVLCCVVLCCVVLCCCVVVLCCTANDRNHPKLFFYFSNQVQ